ncbi:MAG: SLC13 family permease [Nocardioidaceae bacterium]
MLAETVALILLAAVLAAAVARPHGLPEALVAVPAAAVLVAFGVVSWASLRDEFGRLWPILIFLAAVLVLAYLCAAEGLFDAAGRWLTRRSQGRASHLLRNVIGLSAVVTTILSLDATVVLLTPVVADSATRMRVSPEPHVFATGHLSNSASILLPVANLTNLLALGASGLGVAHFAGLMALPFVAVLVVEYVVLRVYFRNDLRTPPDRPHADRVGTGTEGIPRFATFVLAAALVGFLATSAFGFPPYWVAVVAASTLGVHAATRGLVGVAGTAKAVDAPFLLFILGLAIVVRGVTDNGLGSWMTAIVPNSSGLLGLLVFAFMAAALSNVVNNVPALLILLAPAAEVGPVAVLAVLIGVNIGPNLTYTGSLATLLWRRVLREQEITVSFPTFTALGLLSVPACISLATTALWFVDLQARRL